MNLLEQLLSVIPATQREAIQQILNELRKRSNLQTDREVKFEAQRLIQIIKENQQTFDPILAEPLQKIDSAAHNQNMEETFIDLLSLYKETGHLGNVQIKQTASIQSDFNKARVAIFKLINDARIFALRSRKPQFDDIKLINFNIARNTSFLRPIASIDPESRLLKLPEILKNRNHLERRNNKITSVSVELLASGQRGQLSREFDPKKATDSKLESFWAEVIYSDIIIEQLYTRSGINPDTLAIQEKVNGPIAKYTIEYSSGEAVNQVKILPFAPQPIKILEITYRPTASSTIRIPIKDFVIEESLDWIEYNFETVFASDIQIVFAQENYREFILHVPKFILYATDFLIRLLDERQRELSEVPNVEDISLGGNHELYQEAISDLAEIITSKDLVKSPSTEIDLAGKIILSLGETLASFSPEVRSTLEEVTTYTNQLPEGIGDEIQTIKKLEYIIGAREIQTNYILYSPIGNYESQKLEPKSTISNIQIEVDERHPLIDSDFGQQKLTSTEWEIELSEDRKIPIFPVNKIVDGFLPVEGERLLIDFNSRIGVSRLPSQLRFVLVRENSDLLIDAIDYDLVWDATLDGRLQITIKDSVFDKNKIYTIDYFASQKAKDIDVLTKFNSKRLPKPESHADTDSDNRLITEFFPFVNYGIINSDNFIVQGDFNSFRYSAPTGEYFTGLAEVHPNWVADDGTFLPISGLLDVTATSGADWSQLNANFLIDPFNYFLKLDSIPGEIHQLDQLVSSSIFSLKNVPVLQTGLIGNIIDQDWVYGNIADYTGAGFSSPLTGFLQIPYTVSVVYRDGDEIFGFDNLDYTPLNITIGGNKAKNITNYTDLEQPAFTVADSLDTEYEFIHDGKNIFFNQPIKGTETQIDYKWMTKYIKVNCTLRANKIVNPTVTPQVNEYRLLLHTTIL